MMAKKFMAVFFIALLTAVPSMAMEARPAGTVVYIDGERLESADGEYPVLTYKDVVYLPMTYSLIHKLGMAGEWDGEAFYVTLGAMDSDYALPAQLPSKALKNVYRCSKANYPVYIDGFKAESDIYPIMCFDGVTYFPMTWDFAVEKLGLWLEWEDGLRIYTWPPMKVGDTRIDHSNVFVQDIVGDNVYYHYDDYVHYSMKGEYSGTYSLGLVRMKFDPAAGTVEPVAKEDFPDKAQENPFTKQLTLEIADGRLICDGIDIADMSEQEESARQSNTRIGLSATQTELGAYSLVMIDYYFYGPVPSMNNPHKYMFFLRKGDSFRQVDLGEDYGRVGVSIPVKVGGTTYFSVSQWWMQLSSSKMYAADENGEIRLCGNPGEEWYIVGRIGDEVIYRAQASKLENGIYPETRPASDGWFAMSGDGSVRRIWPCVTDDGCFIAGDRLYIVVSDYGNFFIDTKTGNKIPYVAVD